MSPNQLFEEIYRKCDCRNIHLFLFDRPADRSWELVLAEETLKTAIFSWDAIISYRKNKRTAHEQAISEAEIQQVIHPVESKDKAIRILAQLLYRDMAYDTELMKAEEALELAEKFVSLFSEQSSQYYSNSEWRNDPLQTPGTFGAQLNGWSPFTDATFDSGIIVVDKDKIGIAWFEDED